MDLGKDGKLEKRPKIKDKEPYNPDDTGEGGE